MKKQYFHLCTESLKDRLLFQKDKDYRFGMNLIPISLHNRPLTAYCFSLMSNHLHILLSGTSGEIISFFERYKKGLAMYLKQEGNPKGLTKWSAELFPVPDEEAFRKVVAYILRNCLKAGIDSPFSYPWNTAGLYFNPWLNALKGDSLSSLTVRQQLQMFRTHVRLPQNYRIHEGLVLPSSYIDYPRVERLFGTSIDFFKQVRNWKTEDEVEELQTGAEHSVYDDQALLNKLTQDFSDYHVSGFHEMDPVTFRRFIRMMRDKYGASRQQIRRLSGIDDATLERYIH